ncbi:sensor histidine kinase [Ornithinicoccus halotolerans]|uniref:sensor histidine kinase n=1 Tax=Ornithinicoccus halotolerans TaxID=1748220 RepID=UPI001295D7C9|nr:sensor histidine kinase [Ornithinicoccus halotolerans]
MPPRRLTVPLAWAIALGAAALSVAALVIHAQAAALTAQPVQLYLADAWVGLLYPAVGAWLLGQSRAPAAAALMIGAGLLALTGLSVSWVTYDAADGAVGAAGQVAAWQATWTWAPYLLLPTVLPLLYARPGMGTGGRVSRWLLAATAVVTAAVAVLAAVAPGPVNEAVTVANPLGVQQWAGWLQVAAGLPALVMLVLAPMTVVLLGWAWWRERDPRTGAALVGAASFVVAALTAGGLPYPWNDVWTAAGASAMPVAFGVEHQLRAYRDRQEAAHRQFVLARDEERARVRQDLHDGVAPHLAGLGLRVDGIAAGEAIAARDGEPVREELAAVSRGLRDSVVELRRIIDGLGPLAVDQLGLAGAVRAVAEQAGPVTTRVETEELPPLPAPVTVAAYRIVVEAVGNAVRHSGAGHIDIRLGTEPAGLRVEVLDDGVGGADARQDGLGLGGMAARAEALGGRFQVTDREPHGTVVRAVLPVSTP